MEGGSSQQNQNPKQVKFENERGDQFNQAVSPLTQNSQFKKGSGAGPGNEKLVKQLSSNMGGAGQGGGANEKVSTMEFMKQSVLNLNQRVHSIESKIKRVDTILKNQNQQIKTKVVSEKEKWMNQF
mmetsp:Transcript_3865/g.6570  ORF Transcript_3865/g.6570 Transcript_3865/m.6570 type:complete len:126 (+) Transcript_3865:1010-1387(+)